MGLGKFRNGECPCGSKKRYKRCCFDKDYWKGFFRIITKVKDKKTLQEKEVVRYRRMI